MSLLDMTFQDLADEVRKMVSVLERNGNRGPWTVVFPGGSFLSGDIENIIRKLEETGWENRMFNDGI